MAHVSSGELLGRAMAHEIGHLILGTTQHDSRGLMRGRWTVIQLQNNRPRDWSLPRETVAEMGRALRARLHELQKPDEVIAPPTTLYAAECDESIVGGVELADIATW
jgi:hypothetical protein